MKGLGVQQKFCVDYPRYPNDVAKNEFFKKLLKGSVLATTFFVTADQVWTSDGNIFPAN